MKRVLFISVLALLAGLAAGLVYAWAIAPLRTVDAAPSTMRTDFKDQYRTLIAAAYAADHNLERARARLRLLGDADPIEALTAQAQRMLATGTSFQVVQQVAQLANDLQSGEVDVPTPASATPLAASLPLLASSTATASPLAPTQASVGVTTTASATEPSPTEAITSTAVFDTPTARPTSTPIPTPSAPFQLVSQTQVCNPNLTDGLMQVSVLDQHKHQMPGVEIDISWAGGEETFFTGLKPEIGDGYADYVMQPGVVYSLRVGRSGDLVSNLTAPSCPDSNGQTYVGGLKLVFQQP